MHLTAKLGSLCKNHPFLCFKIFTFKFSTVHYYLICEKEWITLYNLVNN